MAVVRGRGAGTGTQYVYKSLRIYLKGMTLEINKRTLTNKAAEVSKLSEAVFYGATSRVHGLFRTFSSVRIFCC